MNFHKDGTLPHNGEMFVFGSNLSGIHGAGAAKVAKQKFGAELGLGFGLAGTSYAIPTKDEKINILPLSVIKIFVQEFVKATQEYKQIRWFVTRVGCGLAGYHDDQIAPMFKGAINCSFAKEWQLYLEAH